MKTKQIQTRDYLLLIDEETEGIELGEIGVNMRHPQLEVEVRIMGGYGSDKFYWSHKKCIAYFPLSEEAIELDLPRFPNPYIYVDFNEFDWADIADEDWKKRGGGGKKSNFMYKQGYVHGAYKAAQPKQFSLKDMRKIAQAAFTVKSNNETLIENFDKWFEKRIQSLSIQNLPKEFIPEYEYIHDDTVPYPKTKSGEATIKTIINSKGKTELVGEYKY